MMETRDHTAAETESQPRLSAGQWRALRLQEVADNGTCVQIDHALMFDGDVPALCMRIDQLTAPCGLAAASISADGRNSVPGHLPRARVHQLAAQTLAERELAIASIARAQREQIRADYRAQVASPLQMDLVVVGSGSARLLLAAPRWCADLHSLRTLARAVASGQACADSPVVLYADLVDLQMQMRVDPEAESDLAYWRDVIARAEASLIAVTGAASHAQRLIDLPDASAARLARLDEVAFLACWQQLLHLRFGDAEVVACSVAARDHDDLVGVFGPLELDLPILFEARESPAQQRLDELAHRLARAREHAFHFPGLSTTDESILQTWRYGYSYVQADHNEHACVVDSEPQSLHLRVTRRNGRVELRISFDSANLDGDAIDWLACQYLALLESVLEHPARVPAPGMLFEARQSAFLADAGRGPRLPISDRNFVARLTAVVAGKPDALALHAGPLQLSYAELDVWSNRVARLLIEEGVRPGHRIGICLPRCARQIASMLGVLKSGCAYVPIDPAYPARRIAAIVAQANLAMIVTASGYLDRVSDSETEIPLIDWDRDADYIDQLSGAAVSLDIHPEQPAYAIFTSGSTGEPKGVEVSHRALTNYVAAIAERLDFTRISSIAALSTVAADLGYTAVFGGLGNGCCLRLLDEALSLDATALAEELAAQPVDCLKIVPSHLAALLAVDLPQRLLPSQALVLGGEPLPWDLVDRVHALSPSLCVVNHYGPTETTIGITCNAQIGPRTPTFGPALGRPLANNRTYVLDTGLQRCAVGIEGELCLAGDGVAAGYLDRPAETAARFLPDPHATAPGARMYASGDRAVFDAAGALRFRGRADQQVKLRGHRVELGDIEAAVRCTSSVRECAVVIVQEGSTARLVVYAVGDGSSEATTRTELAARLPEHMCPAVWVWLDRLPLNANGKLDRRALPDLDQAGRQAGRACNPIEAILLQLCRELLGNARIGIDDNFFAIGADSIVAIQLVARARQQGLFFRPKQVFEQQTIARLAAVVELLTASDGAEQGQVVGASPLTAIQARYFSCVTVDRHQYNQACLYALPADTTFDQLRPAASRLLQHHDALRAAFVEAADGSWRQQFQPCSAELIERSCLDVTIASGADREAVLRTTVEEVQTGFDLATAPLFRLVFIRDEVGAPPLLLAVAHHLVIDSYSWRLIEQDLQVLLADPGAVLAAKTISLRTGAERAMEALASGAWQAEMAYWGRVEQATVPLPLAAASDLAGAARSHRLVLPESIGVALAGNLHQAFNTNSQDFLLAALLSACIEWTGERTLAVMLEGHGRDNGGAGDDDCGRTVGWFTTMYPVALQAPAEDHRSDAIALVTAVKEQLRAVPGNGSGYAALRYLSGQGASKRAAEPELCFNYLGRFAVSDEATHLQTSPLMHLAQHATRSLEQPRLFALEVLAIQHGDQLVVSLVYNPSRIATSCIERICARFQSELERMIAECSRSAGGLTPSDVPDLNLEQHDLDALLSELSEVV